MITAILIAVLLGLVSYIYYYLYKKQIYWKERGIPHIESPLFLGNFFKTTILKESVDKAITNIYNNEETLKEPFVGFNLFHKPAIMLRDPELVKQVLIKDFHHFSNRHTGADPDTDPIGGYNMFQVKNPIWKSIRSKLSPVFTSGKMKQMFYMVEKTATDLLDVVTKRVKDGNGEVEIRNLFAMYTVDSISIVAFATEANCLKDPQNSEFLKNAQSAFMASWWSQVSFNLMFYLPGLMKLLKMTTFTEHYTKFLRRLFNEVVTERETSGGTAHRNDLIDFLVAVKREETTKNTGLFSEDVLLAQASVFFVAGFETSSSTLEFLFYELARNPDVQNKVCEEIRDAIDKNNGKITYEMITNGLPYTTNVINEVLRLYPVLPILDRECGAPGGCTLETPTKSVHIPQGMPIYIPAYSIQRDPNYYTDPEKFDPERFNPEKKTFNEYSYMPFGIGPRNCIGERFAMMQMRVGIAMLLNEFNVEFASNTPKSFDFDKTSILLHPEQKINLKFVKAKKNVS